MGSPSSEETFVCKKRNGIKCYGDYYEGHGQKKVQTVDIKRVLAPLQALPISREHCLQDTAQDTQDIQDTHRKKRIWSCLAYQKVQLMHLSTNAG